MISWFQSATEQYRRELSLAVVALLSIALWLNFGGSTSVLIKPVIAVFHYPFAKIKNEINSLQGVAEANRSLRQQLTEAGLRLSLLEESTRENERLKNILGFEPPTGYRLVPAKVVSLSGVPRPTSALVRLGLQKNVWVDDPVINQDGLVGRVSALSGDFATIQLLTDPSNRVAARVAASREMGIVRTELGGTLILDHLPDQSALAVGDQIISSGLGGVYPPGLVIGRVVRFEKVPDEVFMRVVLRGSANLNRLEEVFILQSNQR